MNDKQVKKIVDKVRNRNVYFSGSGNVRVSGLNVQKEFTRNERAYLSQQVADANRGSINAFQAAMKAELGW